MGTRGATLVTSALAANVIAAGCADDGAYELLSSEEGIPDGEMILTSLPVVEDRFVDLSGGPWTAHGADLQLLVGDLNREIGELRIEIVTDAGFEDAWLLAGNPECGRTAGASPDGCTSGVSGDSPLAPPQRGLAWFSDHQGVMADVGLDCGSS